MKRISSALIFTSVFTLAACSDSVLGPECPPPPGVFVEGCGVVVGGPGGPQGGYDPNMPMPNGGGFGGGSGAGGGFGNGGNGGFGGGNTSSSASVESMSLDIISSDDLTSEEIMRILVGASKDDPFNNDDGGSSLKIRIYSSEMNKVVDDETVTLDSVSLDVVGAKGRVLRSFTADDVLTIRRNSKSNRDTLEEVTFSPIGRGNGSMKIKISADRRHYDPQRQGQSKPDWMGVVTVRRDGKDIEIAEFKGKIQQPAQQQNQQGQQGQQGRQGQYGQQGQQNGGQFGQQQGQQFGQPNQQFGGQQNYNQQQFGR